MESKVNGGKSLPSYLYRRDGSARTAGAVTPSKGGYKIEDTSTTAKVGDIYRAESGTAALIGKELVVIEANTNDFTIASKIAPTAADTFYVLAPVTPRTSSTGTFSIDTTGLATDTKQDTQITSLQLLDDVISTLGSAIPTKGSLIAGSDGTNARALKTDSSGRAINNPITSSSAAITTAPYNASSAQALASTAGRIGAKFFNNTDGDAYIKFGTTASTSSFTVKILTGGYYNMEAPIYTGRVDVIFSGGASGDLLITELT